MPGDRTEQATQHRREKARQDGDILHSRELSAAAGTLAGVLALGMLGPRTMEAWRSALIGFLALGTMAHWEPSTLAPTLVTVRRLTIEVLGPPTIVMALVAMAVLGAGIAQTGGVSVHMSSIAWKPDLVRRGSMSSVGRSRYCHVWPFSPPARFHRKSGCAPWARFAEPKCVERCRARRRRSAL